MNESAQNRLRTLEMFAQGRETEWRNRLIWGDKKYVLPSLLPEFAGKVNLIYIDPPFDTGADFAFTATIPQHPDADENKTTAFTKEPSILEQKAYRDTWGRGLDSYLQWFYETAVLLQELLTSDGSIYVHMDWHVGHYVKAMLDGVFGPQSFLNDIVWQRTASHNDPRRYGIVHDMVLFYSNSPDYTWNDPKMEQSPEYIESFFIYAESPSGEVRKLARGEDAPAGWRRFRLGNFASPHPRPNLTYEYKGYKPPKNGWKVSLERMIELDQQGRLWFPPSKDMRIQTKSYLDEVEEGKPVPDLWLGIMALQAHSQERVDYATQKPEELLERVINGSSNEGDLVLNCFVGSGTTAAVAEKLNRRWIACDLSRFAIHTTRKRLLGIPNVRPFVVQNLGKYERQAWQAAEFDAEGHDFSRAETEPLTRPSATLSPGERAGVRGEAIPRGTDKSVPSRETQAREMAYRKFILDLYHATKAGRMVHVGAVDAPVTLADVKAIAKEVWKAVGTGKDAPQKAGVDILGWEFAFELNELAKQVAAESRVDVSFKKIPREVLDKKAVEQGDVHFFELGALAVNVRRGGSRTAPTVTLRLTDFVIPVDDIPVEVRKAIKHWSQMIDYWAVDWDYKGDTFHNQWQAYRTRKNPKIELETTYNYPESGKYQVVVKVIDILGNDTTKTMEVEI